MHGGFGADGSGFESASDFEFAEPDNALFADAQAGPALAAAVAEAFRQGVAGYMTTLSELPILASALAG